MLMILKRIWSMLGSIVKWSAVILCSIIVGWVLCLVFEDFAPYKLGWEIGMADILSIIIDIILACVIAQVIEKSMNNTRVEKEYFIKELDAVSDIYTELERTCTKDTTLSLINTNYDIGRSRKTLHRMWKMMREVDESYQRLFKKEFDSLMSAIKVLDKQLTDTTTFSSVDGFSPVKIIRNHIYLNKTVKPSIDDTLTEIKERIFRLKIKINKK